MPDDRAATGAEGVELTAGSLSSSDEFERMVTRAILQDIDAIMERVDIGLAAERKAMDAMLARMNLKPVEATVSF
jgi:hypothetical protein